MKQLAAVIVLLLATTFGGAASGPPVDPAAARRGFPQTVRVRLWSLHPPRQLTLRANGHAQLRKCATCKPTDFATLDLRAAGSQIEIASDRTSSSELDLSGAYQMNASDDPPIRGDFPLEIRAGDGALLITALMPMDEYIAGVLAGEVGNFKSDEALKAMAVAARTYAMHFGSRHALEGFDFCDTTHCQDLRVAGITQRLRNMVESTSGELLWYDGEPAATYYFANCGGSTEDGRYILGNNEERAPYLVQHSDHYCTRNGGSQWRSEVSRRDLQRALSDDGIAIPGTLREVTVAERTASGRVEFLRVTGNGAVMVPALAFRSAVGRHIGWDRLKSNWYDVSAAGDRFVFHGRGFGHGVGLCQIGAEVMGEEGRNYRQILAFYYPGTRLGVSAQGIAWQQFSNDDVTVLSTRPERDKPLLALATRLMHDNEESTGLLYRATPRLKVYATVAAFRDSTGEPGWMAASTRGRNIRLQPMEVLEQTGALESTLRHELLHMLIESYAKAGTPLWFREGLVLYLSDVHSSHAPEAVTGDTAGLEKSLRSPASEQDLRHAYAQAQARVAEMARRDGRAALFEALQNGGISN